MTIMGVGSAGADLSSKLAAPNQGIDWFTRLVAVGALAVVVAAIATAAQVGRGTTTLDSSTPEGVTLVFETAVRQGDAERAWGLLSSSARSELTPELFRLRVARYEISGDAQYSTNNVRMHGDTAQLDFVVSRRSGSVLGLGASTTTSRNPVTLMREEGLWRVEVPAEPYVITSYLGAPV